MITALGFRSMVIYTHMLKSETTSVEVGGREGGRSEWGFGILALLALAFTLTLVLTTVALTFAFSRVSTRPSHCSRPAIACR